MLRISIPSVYVRNMRFQVPQVRAQAVETLTRVQDCEDEEDEVLSEFLRLLASDTAQSVRASVLKQIALSRVTLPHVLKRTR